MRFSKISLKLIAFLFALQSQNAIAAVGDTDEICVSLQNVAVTGYLADAEVYDNNIGRAGTSALVQYAKNEKGEQVREASQWLAMVVEKGGRMPGWAEQPSPVTINTEGGTKIKVSTTPDFASSLEFTASGNETQIYNLVPQTVYWYKVLNSAGKTIKSGLFKTTGDIRMVETERVLNVRDMGGWMLNSTSRMAYGKIFRGGRLDGKDCTLGAIDTSDKHRLLDILGIKANLNLMNTSEIPTGKSNPLNVSDFLRKDFNHYMYLLTNTLYDSGTKKVNSKDYNASIIAALEYVVECLKNNKPVFINCSMGADRTGMLCLIIEAICGMKEAEIVKDWELTSFNSEIYCKYIDYEELKYRYMEGGTLKTRAAEMRSVFNYFYDNYYNRASYAKDIQGMVCYWLRQDVFKDTSRANAVIYALQDLLLCYHYKSPVIIRDGGKRSGYYNYLVSDQTTSAKKGTNGKELTATKGNAANSDNGYHTDYIDCAGQTKLLVNAGYANIACFYDANKQFISGIADSNVTTQYGKDAVIFGYREYAIPEGAAYVRLNVKKNCDWTAVLMRDNKTTYEIENNL